MSISTPNLGTNSAGQAQQGTQGSTIQNNSATTLSTNQFLNLMMDELRNQNPLNPSSSDPTQYLTELAQMTSVEQQTNTAQNTQITAQAQAVSQAISLIGDSVTYVDQKTGNKITGSVDSVQITSSGPTLTVAGTSGVLLSSIINVTPQSGSSPTSTGSGTGTTSGTGSTTGSTSGTGTGTTTGTGA
jgi:flagellar basal-body rod modification protein FlgD